LTRPSFTGCYDTLFQDTCLQPFLDQADDARIADPVVQEADQPVLADRVEERPEIAS
jgi:hypothetical protein